MLCKIHNRQLEAPAKWKIFSCLRTQLQGCRKLTNNANTLRSIGWCYSWNAHPTSRRSITPASGQPGNVGIRTGMLRTPSLSANSNQENEFQSNHDHGLTVAFGLASASLMLVRPILLLIIRQHPAVPRCVSPLGQSGFSWVGSGSGPCSLVTKSNSPVLREIFSKIQVTNHLHLNTKGNFHIALYNYVRTQ